MFGKDTVNGNMYEFQCVINEFIKTGSIKNDVKYGNDPARIFSACNEYYSQLYSGSNHKKDLSIVKDYIKQSLLTARNAIGNAANEGQEVAALIGYLTIWHYSAPILNRARSWKNTPEFSDTFTEEAKKHYMIVEGVAKVIFSTENLKKLQKDMSFTISCNELTKTLNAKQTHLLLPIVLGFQEDGTIRSSATPILTPSSLTFLSKETIFNLYQQRVNDYAERDITAAFTFALAFPNNTYRARKAKAEEAREEKMAIQDSLDSSGFNAYPPPYSVTNTTPLTITTNNSATSSSLLPQLTADFANSNGNASSSSSTSNLALTSFSNSTNKRFADSNRRGDSTANSVNPQSSDSNNEDPKADSLESLEKEFQTAKTKFGARLKETAEQISEGADTKEDKQEKISKLITKAEENGLLELHSELQGMVLKLNTSTITLD